MKKKYIQYFIFIILICAAVYIIPQKISILLNNKGFLAYTENDYEKALKLYEQSAKIYPRAETFFNIGSVYEKRGDIQAAIKAFKKALDVNPGYIPAYKEIARVYAQNGDYSQAESYLLKLELIGAPEEGLMGADPKRDRIVKVYNRGVRHYVMGQEEKALADFKQVIEIDASNFLSYKAAADIFSNQGDFEKALTYYKRGVALGLQDPDAFNSMGIICMKREDYSQGVRYFKKALGLDPNNLHYMFNLASTLRDDGKFFEAISLYKKVVERSPRYPNAHNDIAGIYELWGSKDKAKREYQKEYDITDNLIKSGAKDNFTLTRFAVACNGLNRSTKAKQILDDIISNDPKYSKAYFARGHVYNKLGQRAESRDDFLRAKKLAANIAAPTNDIAKQDTVIKKPSEATAEFFKEDAVIHLYNGHIVHGSIKRETDTKIILKIQTGKALSVITFPKSKIKKIEMIN